MNGQLNINPFKYPNVKCECGNEIWNHGIILKKIPGIELGTGTEDQFMDFPVFYCSKCGKILPEYREIYKLDEASTEKPSTNSPLILQ